MLTFLLRKRDLLHEKKGSSKETMCRKRTASTQKIVKVCAKIRVCRATHTISGMHVDISLSREPHMYSSPTCSCFFSLPLISMSSCVSADQYTDHDFAFVFLKARRKGCECE